MLEIKLFRAMSVTTPNGTVTASELGGVSPRQILEILARRGSSAEAPAGGPALGRLPAPLVRQHAGELPVRAAPQARPGRGRVSAIRTTNHGYVLDPAAATTDLHEFRTCCRLPSRRTRARPWASSSRPSTWPRGSCSPASRTPGGPARSGRSPRASSWAPPPGARHAQPRRAGGGAHGADRGERRRAGGGSLAVVDARLLALRPALGGTARLLRAAEHARRRARSRPGGRDPGAVPGDPGEPRRPAARSRTGATRC